MPHPGYDQRAARMTMPFRVWEVFADRSSTFDRGFVTKDGAIARAAYVADRGRQRNRKGVPEKTIKAKVTDRHGITVHVVMVER